jgi:PhnB protein
MGYKPDGYTSVAPYLIVSGAAKTLAFLERAFGAVEIRRFPGPHGSIMHAEVRLDDTVVMLADGVEDWPPVASHVHVYVPDVDAAYRRALEAGANSVQKPTKKDDADKRGGVIDPGGTTWWISTKID